MIDTIKKIVKLIRFPFVLSDWKKFQKNNKRFECSLKDLAPQVYDRTSETGFEPHYTYHTSWAARKVKEINPAKHIDISSSLFFNGIVSAFVPIDFYDFRPAKITLSNLFPKKGDLMNLDFADNSIISLSCMHTIEHIGLGRYGDPIDCDADIKAINELKRVLAVGGNLLFVTPLSKPKIYFNSHRSYSYEMIMELFKGLRLKEFSLITDSKELIINADPNIVKDQKDGCGCFWFVKD